MRKWILAAAAMGLVTIGPSMGFADHRRPPRYDDCRPYRNPHVGQHHHHHHHGYRVSPFHGERYSAYRFASPYYHHRHVHPYSPYYYGSSVGVYGRGFSLRIGF